MTDQILNILKFALLGLLYLFFARVLWAVWSEVRTPKQRPAPPGQHRSVETAHRQGNNSGQHNNAQPSSHAKRRRAAPAASAAS